MQRLREELLGGRTPANAAAWVGAVGPPSGIVPPPRPAVGGGELSLRMAELESENELLRRQVGYI